RARSRNARSPAIPSPRAEAENTSGGDASIPDPLFTGKTDHMFGEMFGEMRRPPVALTIAGSDSGGGAGIVADAKTFTALGVWATVAVVAVTAQNTLGVRAVELVTPGLVVEQILAVSSDVGVDAAKTGMLGSAELVAAVAG